MPRRLADGTFAEVKGQDHFICSRFRFFFQNVIIHIHISSWAAAAKAMARRADLRTDATPVTRLVANENMRIEPVSSDFRAKRITPVQKSVS